MLIAFNGSFIYLLYDLKLYRINFCGNVTNLIYQPVRHVLVHMTHFKYAFNPARNNIFRAWPAPDRTYSQYKGIINLPTFCIGLNDQLCHSRQRTREFEPDAPNYTPRISGIIELEQGGFSYTLSILKSDRGNPDACLRFFYEYAPVAGQGHFIHTYEQDGDPLPSFEGEPVPVEIAGDIDAFTETVWNSLDTDNRVSLFTRFIDLKTGGTKTRIVNKHEG